MLNKLAKEAEIKIDQAQSHTNQRVIIQICSSIRSEYSLKTCYTKYTLRDKPLILRRPYTTTAKDDSAKRRQKRDKKRQ